MDFLQFKGEAEELVKELQVFVSESSLKDQMQVFQVAEEDLSALLHRLHSESFTVGVVGVFNSGKSSFLNALLGRELLSMFILPETAAITKLSYGEEERAEVTFWSQDEWDKIKLDAEARKSSDPSVLEAIEQQEQNIGAELSRVITNPPLSKEIKLSELKDFTAKKGSYSAFIREVNLYVNLEFCQDNISIVDTPGLNDPVQLRELVTRKYFLPNCDLIIFLVPAGQAFSKFDEDFLIDQANSGHLNKLFLVVNKVDQLDKSEIDQVVEFAQSSAQTAIARASETSAHIAEIETFPLSAKQALLHRSPKEGSTPSMSLAETGVEDFEERLRSFLFQGERAQGLMRSLYNKLSQGVISPLRQALSTMNVDAGSVEEIKEKLRLEGQQLNLIRMEVQHHEQRIEMQKTSLNAEVSSLLSVFEHRVSGLDKDLFDHVMGAVNAYMEERNGFSAAWNFKEWANDELPEIITQGIKQLVEREVKETSRQLSEVMQRHTQQVQVMLDQLDQRIETVALNVDGMGAIGEALLGTAIEVAIATALRAMIPAVVALVSAEIAAILAPLIAGPIGVAILVVVAGIGIFKGESKIKSKLIATMKQELPGPLRELTVGLSQSAKLKLEEGFQEPLNTLFTSFDLPGEQLRAQLDAREEAERLLLSEFEESQEAFEQRVALLQAERERLDGITANFEGLCAP
jgi:predicted GTPase